MTLSTEELLRLTVSALMSRTGERQGDLAQGLGQAQAQVSRKQSGRQHWSLDDVDRLAAHYRIGVLDLLAGPTHAVQVLSSAPGAQGVLPLAVPPSQTAARASSVPRSEALGGPCVLCGERATDAVEGIWQHLTSEECADALGASLDGYPEDENQEEEHAPTGPGEPATPHSGDLHPGPHPAPGGPQLPAVVTELTLAPDPEHPDVPRPTDYRAAPQLTPVEPELPAPGPASAPAPAPAAPPAPNRAPGYASTTLVGQINGRVRDVLEETQGDMEAAQAALIKKAIPDVMALFDLSRVGGRYAHSKFPASDDILHKKSQKSADQIWEGRPKWRNDVAFELAKKGEKIDVTALDMNAAYLAAFKCWLPIGKLVEDETARAHDPKRSGVYQITPPVWEHPDLPNPLGSRKEPGPVWVPDSVVRLLLDCAKWGLCESPEIHRALLSGATESLLEKLRRALAEARATAIANNDEITTEYIKAMYSKFVSTVGESSANTELRRPDWMHIIRSKAFTNLWRKAYKAREAGLTVIQMSGTDELHVAGDWRPVFAEGRALNEVKAKKIYSLGGNR
ncbi:acyltransferase [Streptomyces sp. NPDC052196]|uniref:acyltransferase n=1 Tax=Streptomyces sp. NPDC052196 TaxID=3156691 RepID=UPI003420EA50